MWYVLREARSCIFSRAPGTSPPAHLQQRLQGSRQGKAMQMCCKKWDPTWKPRAGPSLGLPADSCPRRDEWDALGHSWAQVLGWGGEDGAASAPNPASHHVSLSWLGLRKGNSLRPCSRKPSWASLCVERQIAASLPCLWTLAKTLFVFSSVWNVLCVFLAQLISYNTQLLQFLSAAQIIADQM